MSLKARLAPRAPYIAAAALLIALVGLSWALRFVQDDAFISYRYAQNLVQGRGLVWNPGERVEGYTNFLWVLLMAAAMRLGVEPVIASQALGLAAYAASLALTFLVAGRLLGSPWLGALTMFLLGANFTFSSYATGGLETSLQTALLLGIFALVLRGLDSRRWSGGTLLLLSVLAAAALMTRLDSLLLAAPFLLLAIVAILRQRVPFASRARQLLALALPAALLLGAWFAWKLAYYGDLLPNTFYAKTGGIHLVALGVQYLFTFVQSYWLWLYLPLGIAAMVMASRTKPWMLLLFAVGGIWAAYVVWDGGDFMEFRFLVPVLPYLMVLIVWLSTQFVTQPVIRLVLVEMVLLGSVSHTLTYGVLTPEGHVEPISRLRWHVSSPNEAWASIGRVLGQAFGRDSGTVIAVVPAGAIPYYSGLTTVDMLGLSDAWVARNGIDLTERNWPGHRRGAPLSYLRERGVNLVLGSPQVRKIDIGDNPESVQALYSQLTFIDYGDVPADARLIEIPLDDTYFTVAWYLTPSAEVDAVAAREGWRIRPAGPQACCQAAKCPAFAATTD
jgi:arabinofuranosyltransferase